MARSAGTESSVRNTLTGAAYLSLQPLMLNVLSVPVMAYIIRRLGPVAYGQWAVAMSLLAVGAVVANPGLRGMFVRAIAREPDSARTALAEQLGLRLLLSLISGLAATLVCSLLGYPPVILWCTAVGAVGAVFTTFATTLADLLQSLQRLKSIAGANLAAGIGLTTASALAAWMGAGPVGIAAAYLVGPTCSALLLLIIARRHCPISVRWDLKRFATLIKDSRFFAAQHFLTAASTHAESLMLPRLVGVSHFGFFSAGSLLATRLTVLPDGLCTAAYPAMAAACSRGQARGASTVLTYLLLAVIVGVAVAATVMLVAKPVAQLLFPRDPATCAAVIRVTIWMLPLVGLESVMGYALNAAGRDAAQARAYVPASIASLVVTVGLVTQGGVMGACWSMVLRPVVRACFLAPVFIRTFFRAAPPSMRLAELQSAIPETTVIPVRKAG